MPNGYMLKKAIFWTHLILGVVAGVIVFIMAVTGVMLAFEPQIVDAAEKKIRRVEVPTEPAKRLSANEIVAKARVGNPELPVSGLMVNVDPARSAAVSFGRELTLFVNPYSGEVLGKVSKTHDFMHWIEDFHRTLALKEKGKTVTGFANAFFAFLAVSGLYLWWPGKVMKFKSGLQGKAKDWNWHNVIGFWCLPMIFVTTLTGLVMSYTWANNLLFRMTGNESPPPMQQRMASGAKSGMPAGTKPVAAMVRTEMNWDGLVESVTAQVPAWNSIGFRMREPGAPVSAFIEEPSNRPWMRSQMTIDGATGKILNWEPYAQMNSGKKARIWTKYLHTGESFGIVTQLIALASACGVILLVWTGFAMAWRRFFTQGREFKK